MSMLSAYERKQHEHLRRWQAKPPDLGSRLLSKPTGMAGRVMQAVIPESALEAALNGAGSVALKLSDHSSILKRAGVSELAALREQPLEVCDNLARNQARIAMAMGGISGGVFGVAGAAGLVADVPTLLMGALRTVHRVGLCFGEDASKHLMIGVFALASASTRDEKRAAVEALRTEGIDLPGAALRGGLERAAERELAKEAAVFSLHTVARRVSAQLGRRMAIGVVPVLGAAVGGAVNAWYVRDVAQTAQYVFQDRWLMAKYPELRGNSE
ncbi:MAG: EcsC family protein [Stenotrophobium sp.]